MRQELDMPGTSAETLEQIEALDIMALKRLALYAVRCFRRLNFQTTFDSGYADGFSPEDIVSTALLKILQGNSRQWDAENCPDFMGHLKGVIRSEVSNACRRHRDRQTGLDTDLSALAAGEDAASGTPEAQPSFLERLPDHAPSPEERAQVNEMHRQLERFIATLSPELQKVNEQFTVAIEAGCETPKEIAEITDMSVETVYNHKRTLKRRLEKFKQ